MPYKPNAIDIYREATKDIPSTVLEDALLDILKSSIGGGGLISSKVHAGAKGDGKQLQDVTFSSANSLAPFNLMNSPSGQFKTADVGKVGWVRGAGAGGTAAFFEIAEVLGPSQVRLAAGVAQNSGSSYTAFFGTDDTAALTLGDQLARAAGRPFWIEPGIYMANLNMDRGSSNPAFYWFGHQASTLITSARDLGYTAQFLASANSFVTDYVVSGLRFSYASGFSTAVQRGKSLRIGRHDYGLIENISTSGGLIGLEHFGSFGNRIRRLKAGDNQQSSYGYVAYGVADAYCGWNSFEHPVFKGRKCAYLVDNSLTPAFEAGEGNHILEGDWEAITTGLAYYARKQGNAHKLERLVSCWFEGNLGSGSVDMSDLTMLPRPVGTVNFKRQIYITSHVANPAVPQFEYPSMVSIEGSQPSPHVVGSYVDIEQFSGVMNEEPVFEPGVSPQGGVSIKRAVAEYHDAAVASGIVLNYQVDEIWSKRSTPTDGCLFARAKQHKTAVDYSQKNYLLSPSPTTSGRGLVLSGAGASVSFVDDGPGIYGALEVTLPAGGNVQIAGAAFGNGYADTGYTSDEQNAFCYASFAIRALSPGLTLDLKPSPTGTAMANQLKLEDTSWKTYQGVRRQVAWSVNISNPGTSSSTFRLANLQAVLFTRHRDLLDYARTDRLAGTARDGVTRLFKSVGNSQLGLLIAQADFGQPPKDANSGLDLLSVPIGQRNNGNFDTWPTTSQPAAWTKGDPIIGGGASSIVLAQETADTISGSACRFTSGTTDPGDGNANSRDQRNWLTNNQLTVGRRYRMQGWFKWISSPSNPGHLCIGTAYGESIIVVNSSDPTKGSWQWKVLEFNCLGFNGDGKFFFCGQSGPGGDVWLLDQIQVVDITKL